MHNSLLPIYFLIDTSSSMESEDKIGSVNEAIRRMLRLCKESQYTRDVALISIIRFNSYAELLLPITELKNCNPPRLKASGSTALGSTFDLLRKRLEIDNSHFSKYFREPIVFLLTDGFPTDDYAEPLAKLKNFHIPFRSVAIGFGADADFSVLREFAGNDTYQMNKMADNDFFSLFSWIGEIVERRANALIHSKTEWTALKGKDILALRGKPKPMQLSHRELLMLPPPPNSLKKV